MTLKEKLLFLLYFVLCISLLILLPLLFWLCNKIFYFIADSIDIYEKFLSLYFDGFSVGIVSFISLGLSFLLFLLGIIALIGQLFFPDK